MNYEHYTRNVQARCSDEFHGHLVDECDFKIALAEFIEAGNRLDRLKKSLFYGQPFSYNEGREGLVVDCPLETPNSFARTLIHAILGVATEGTELVEALFAYISDQPWDIVNLCEEFGDLEWYRALGLSALGETNEHNLQRNDRKLELRFGPAFSAEGANTRDLEAERKILEG